VAAPDDLEDGEVFRLFDHALPANPFPLPVRLDALLPSGERAQLISVSSIGGRFTVPYRLPVNTVLVLSVLDREVHRETVRW
jgi:hypothetical protein